MATYPLSAVVGADDMVTALLLVAISPQIGGVLVRGEKGTAKSTAVRALAELLPPQDVVQGCRFACDPAHPDPACPDGPHVDPVARTRPARLVELPVGATEDRVTGSLDLERALGEGRTAYEPGLLAAAHRGMLYVDEVNLLHDHLVDLLLDAAAMGRCTVERDGVSLTHAARLVLVGTMNPEEGELRPQLLDRFGLTAQVSAPRDPARRVEVVRRRMAYDADPAGFAARFAAEQESLAERIRAAQRAVAGVALGERALLTIAHVCAGFEVDGMRADLVTARAAMAHAAWCGRDSVTRADIRAAARLALPHRRRRNPFDAPGLDEDLLDRLLDEADGPDPDGPEPDGPEPDESPGDAPEDPGPGDGASEPERPPTDAERPQGPAPDAGDPAHRQQPGGRPDHIGADQRESPEPAPRPEGDEDLPAPGGAGSATATPHPPYRARLLAARGTGAGVAGRRSRAYTSLGKVVGVAAGGAPTAGAPLHLPATIRSAAPHQHGRGRAPGGPLRVRPADVRRARTQGRESNLVLFAVDASGSMAARARMGAVKGAVLALLLDAYQRRDKVALVTFRGAGADLVLPPTSSVDVAARRLADLRHGGRTPLAAGLTEAARTLEIERLRDPRRRPLLVVVTDGRGTGGRAARAQVDAHADRWRADRLDAVVVDCEAGRVRLGLARDLAARLDAHYLRLEEVAADALVGAVTQHTGAARGAAPPAPRPPSVPSARREEAA